VIVFEAGALEVQSMTRLPPPFGSVIRIFDGRA
jgi:hypothetical protein